jgi:alpha-2-macroglobulin
MKAAKKILLSVIFIFILSCGSNDKKVIQLPLKEKRLVTDTFIPIDKGFDEYISAYTSGIIPANSPIEIRFTQNFAIKTTKEIPAGLFVFEPAIKGKTEWEDEKTLIFRPSGLLDAGKLYTGSLNLYLLSDVPERLKAFPLRIQTMKKDFRVTLGALECPVEENNSYLLKGEIITSDFIESSEVEKYLEAKLGKKKILLAWEHSEALSHKFTISGIGRTNKSQELVISWDGSEGKVKQKGSYAVRVPPSAEFSVIDVIANRGESQQIDIIFSDPVDATQDIEGLIWFDPGKGFSISKNSNIITLLPETSLQGVFKIKIEPLIKNRNGVLLSTPVIRQLDFTAIYPGIKLSGNGVILPSSQNLIFPFKAANLRAVDLKIIKIFENNLPYYLQNYEINTGYSVKRFGRPVYSGKVDLINVSSSITGTWNLYSINLADYIDVEPGVLYKVELGMRRSYSTYPCTGQPKDNKYEEALQQEEAQGETLWSDSENYYEDSEDIVYYSFRFKWEDRNDPCKDAYYSPQKKVSRNILASNLGLIAKKGEDNLLHVMVNDLISALPVSEVNIDVFDYQMQLINSGNTNQDGSVSLRCKRKPFLLIAKKDKDRNYLKINDGASLSLSSFDVSGNKPENGIKAFIYGERDVWRPGDSIFLSLFIKDMIKELPQGHPVQFELINPLEQKTDIQVQKLDGRNLIVFKTKTTPDALTGNYRAQFKIGGANFTKRIRIETIKPNRLKINLNFSSEMLGGWKGIEWGTLNVKWLNGAIARNLKTSVDFILKHTKTEFEKYGQYVFDDPVKVFNPETVSIFYDSVDEEGNAKVPFSAGAESSAPGMMNVIFTTKVTEPGGEESISQTTLKYAPFPVFAGINFPGLKGKNRMLYTDNENEVRVVTVDKNGKPVRSEVEITVYKISYRWWWESDKEDLAQFISNRNYKPVIRKNITTSGGEGSFTFKIDKNEWGRYLVRASTPGGHSTGKIVLIDWPWDYGMKGNTQGATLLAINTDKEKYIPGDEIELSFPAPENARAIVTLENSTGVLEEIRVNSVKTNTVVRFKARPEMAPNIYAYVTVIQPHNQTVNDMPVRLYGVVPVMVEDPGTRLLPQISVADEIRSQKPFEIKVSEADKKAMTYTLAVVDEGLLDITGFKTPDPWNYFYAREALGVKTWDLYDFVLGAFGGALERLFAIGGDETIIDKSAGKTQRFIPVVRFFGPFSLDAGKTNSHTLTLPQYTGSVKTMVIAGNDRAFGASEKPVIVKDPLMVLVTAPRVISPGEKASLPVTVFVQKSNITTLNIQATGNDLIKIEENTKNLQISGEGEKDTEYKFVAGEKCGVGKIKVVASGGGETADFDLEIEVRSPNPPETRSEMKLVGQKEKWETTFIPFGIEGSNSARIEISMLPSVNLEKRLDYLAEFPYGCSEQITSTAFSQLYLSDLSGNDPEAAQAATANIKEAISSLISRQMTDGGIALWPGASQPDNWVTSYAGHFMIEAEKLGYSIPMGFKQKWINYQKKYAREWKYDTRFKVSSNDQAYRLLTLALAGEPEKGAMNRLRETSGIPQLSRWVLAAAFATTGRSEVASDLLDMRVTETEPEFCNYYYGSQIRDKALILYTLTLLKKEEAALPLLKDICDILNKDTWLSTQSVAWSLFAYMKWIAMIPGDKTSPGKVILTINGEKKEHTIQKKQLLTMDLKMAVGKNQVTVENISEKPFYVTLTRKGTPLISNSDREEKGLSMKIDYLTLDMKPLDHLNLKQGTNFMMTAKVTNNTFTRIDNIALIQMVASGWEIQNIRLFDANYGMKESISDYRDFRDDRVNTFFTLNQGETKTFILILNASYKGDFFQPSIWCEAMYIDNCYSRYPGTRVKVTGQN